MSAGAPHARLAWPFPSTEGAVVKPTIVLVHGAFAESSSWNAIVEPLQTAGHEVVAVANPLRAVASDAQYVTDVVRGIDGPVVLVGHSYGGCVITNVAADAGEIVGLVFLAGFASDAGETPGELAGRFPGATLAETLKSVPQADGSVDLYIAQDRYHAQFAADLPEGESRRMGATQRPILASAFDDPTVDPLWRSVPSWFMFGELDRNIPVAAHRFMAERAGARRTVEIAGASHVAGMSHPEELIELVLEAADAPVRAIG
jgi:pimeloyl-ACP methyl ester carboxylesterase